MADGEALERGRRIDVKLVHGNIADICAPAYVLGVFDNVNPTGAAKSVDNMLGGALSALVQEGMIGSRLGEISLLPMPRRALKADLIAFAGLGPISTFNARVLETVAENLARVFITTQVHSFATVVIGSNAGVSIEKCLNSSLNGLIRGLARRDTDHDFRTIYVCELDGDRYAQLESAGMAYVPPRDAWPVDLVRRKIELPNTTQSSAFQRVADSLDITYLTVEQPDSRKTNYKIGVLTSGLGAAISAQEHPVDLIGRKKAQHKLNTARRIDTEFSEALAELYLPEDSRAAMLQSLKKSDSGYLVVAHDRHSADIPWEAMQLADGYCPATQAGISRKLTTRARIAGRSNLPRDTRLKMLLVRNPTKDLPGAEEECDYILKMFRDRGMEPTILAHEKATTQAILEELESNDYDILHYAGHAIYDPRRISKSGLICHQQKRLTADMLSSVERLPQLVVLNGCQTGKVRGEEEEELGSDEAYADAETRGFWERLNDNLDDQASFAEALMLKGVMNMIGTSWPVSDRVAPDFAQNLYASLLTGDRLGTAMRKARRAVCGHRNTDWANYMHYGDPEYVLRRA